MLELTDPNSPLLTGRHFKLVSKQQTLKREFPRLAAFKSGGQLSQEISAAISVAQNYSDKNIHQSLLFTNRHEVSGAAVSKNMPDIQQPGQKALSPLSADSD